MSQTFFLNQWQRRQASLLYYFSSPEYLIGLRDRVNHLKSFAEGKTHQSRIEGRDRVLHSPRWGNRDTTENWSNNAWPFLADFQLSVAKAISDLPSEIYYVTGTHQCARGMSEFSMQWATTAEEKEFDVLFASISDYAHYIDCTMQKRQRASKWSDFGLTLAWTKHAQELQRMPKFRVLTDVISDSNKIPPRTGVYVSFDDPHASLQFAWKGSSDGELLPSRTFNDFGLAALTAVGRSRLWIDQIAMCEFINANLSHPALASESYLKDPPEPSIAPSLVARHAFTSRSTRWCFVEPIEGEFEFVKDDTDSSALFPLSEKRRFHAGEICDCSGYYFTPARVDSRHHFGIGEIFPDVGSAYGKSIWQWDTPQE